MKARARLRHRAGVVVAIAAAVVAAAGGVTGSVLTASSAADAGARTALAAAERAEPVVTVSIRWAGQGAESAEVAEGWASEQDAAVREALAASTSVPVLEPVFRIRSEPLALAGVEPRVVLWSDAALRDRGELIEGAWPSGPDGAALHADAAAALGLEVGDRLALPTPETAPGAGAEAGSGSAEWSVTVTALWRPADPRDPVWAGDPLSERGVTSGAVGPLVIDDAVWASLDTRPIAQWVAALAPADASIATLESLTAAVPTLAERIDADERSRGTGVVVEGGLPVTAERVLRAAAGLTAVPPLAIGLVVLLAIATLLQLNRLLALQRDDEVLLLRVRGASPRRLIASGALEAATVALPAALLGAGVAAAVLPPSAGDPLAVLSTAVGCALAVAVAAVVIATLVAAGASRRPLTRERAAASGRVSRVVGVSTLVVVLMLAAASIAQYLANGGPLVATGGGAARLDLIAALAPLALLTVAALAVLVAAGPLVRAAARLAAAAPSAMPVLVLRPLARSAAMLTATVLLVTLAVGGTALVVVVDATSRAAERAAREVAVGAPITVAGVPLDEQTRAALGAAGEPAEVAGLRVAGGPVAVAPLALADQEGTLLVVDAEVLRSTAAGAGAVDRERLADALRAGDPPMRDLPAGARSIRIDTSAGLTAPEAAAFWLADPVGGVVRLAAAVDGTAALPPSGGPWRLLAIDRVTASSGPAVPTAVRGVAVVDADGAETPLPFLEPWLERPGLVDDASAGVVVRLAPEPQEPRLALTAAAAAVFDVGVGDRVTARLAGSSRAFTGTIAIVVPVLPGATGTGPAVAIDAVAAAQQQLTVAEHPLAATGLWLSPIDAEADDSALPVVVEAIRAALPPAAAVRSIVTPADASMAEGARELLWVGALSSLAIAALGVGAAGRVSSILRRDERAVLRAVGVGAGAYGRIRAVETVGVLSTAALAGFLVGVGIAMPLAPGLVRALLVDAPTALPIVIRVDVALAAALAAGLVVVVLGAATATGIRSAREARRLAAREVLR